LVGEDPASIAYAQMKGRWAEKCGIEFALETLPAHTDDAGLEAAIRRRNAQSDVDAILVEMPLPGHLDGARAQRAVAPEKDVEGVTPTNLGRLITGTPGPRPATAVAILSLLDDAGIPLEGARAVVVGRSAVVGKPAALLLLGRHATVTIAHTRTVDLASVTRGADVIVAAAGSPGLITPHHVREGAVVIDAGTTFVGEGEHGRLTGDADYEGLVDHVAAITPVPGGVGPVTTAVLLKTAVDLAESRVG
jgi:methylenetetrahydrofolate dehydrogenase (NADP+)/methenyltetrahydrofolate cyclohydrolase